MYLPPHFPHSHFSYSPVSPLFPCFSVSLLVCSLFFTFLCSFVLLSSYVSRHPCSERSSLSRFLFPTSLFPLSHSLVISFLFFQNIFCDTILPINPIPLSFLFRFAHTKAMEKKFQPAKNAFRTIFYFPK